VNDSIIQVNLDDGSEHPDSPGEFLMLRQNSPELMAVGLSYVFPNKILENDQKLVAGQKPLPSHQPPLTST
jgi:hypothetical protein